MNLDSLNNNLVIFVIVLWESIWKGIALWKSAKRGDSVWFVAIFVVNFFGVLPIFYLWHTKQLNDILKDAKNLFKKK